MSGSLAGSWCGRSDDKLHESLVEIDMSLRNDVWYMVLRDRRYRETPERPIKVSEDGRAIEATFPHWITAGTISLNGKLVGDTELQIEIDGQGMTGQDRCSVSLTRDVDGDEPRLAAFRRPLPQPVGTLSVGSTGSVAEQLLQSVATKYAGSSREPLRPRIEAMMIVQDGVTLMEEYLWGMTSTTMHMISSCTKSIVAILAGIAVDQGLFGLEDSIASHFPWLQGNTDWGDEPAILVRHVLSMTAGTTHSPADSQALLVSSDVEAFTLASSRVAAPGTRYHYDNSLPSLVGCLIERTSGLTLPEFAARHLFEPLGIREYRWTYTPKSTSLAPPPHPDSPRALASGGLYMTIPDFVKIGRLLLDGGVWGDRRLVSKEYLAAATGQRTDVSDYPYGYYIHLNSSTHRPTSKRWVDDFEGYLALGQGEQFLAVSPSNNLLIAAFSSTWHKESKPDTMREETGEYEAAPLWIRGTSDRNPSRRNYAVFDCLNEFGLKRLVAKR